MSNASKSIRKYPPVRKKSDSHHHPAGTVKLGKMVRLGVISNPLSGGNQKGLYSIREALARRSQAYHFEATTPSEVGSAVAELAHREVDILAVNGGDGTIHAVLTELFRRPAHGPVPLLALLRSGTASMIARDLGLRGSQHVGITKLLRLLNTGCGSGTVVQRPVLKVTREPDQKPLYGMFFGAAAVCRGIQFCLDRVHSKGVGGELAAGLTLARFLLAATRGNGSLIAPESAAVGLDGEPQEQREFLLVLISTLERLFLGIRPFWSSEAAPLHYTALSTGPKHLLRALPRLLRGRKSRFATQENGYFGRKVRKAYLTLSGSFTLDGEIYEPNSQPGPVTVTEGGKASFLKL